MPASEDPTQLDLRRMAEDRTLRPGEFPYVPAPQVRQPATQPAKPGAKQATRPAAPAPRSTPVQPPKFQLRPPSKPSLPRPTGEMVKFFDPEESAQAKAAFAQGRQDQANKQAACWRPFTLPLWLKKLFGLKV
ncbi:hypothetical protein HY224_02450 [Candidatus Uhrbacteria bacterium]|nr:hypothetical protein [Candidatus Uhrbacteria bacterium]